MATSTPPQVSKRSAGVSGSPSHLNSASPTAARHASSKTPVNHPTSGSSGGKTLASTPMVQNLSQSGITSSPSTNMFGFNTPGAAALDGITPAIMNIPTPALGGTQMIPTMSDLGLTTSSGKRNEDEERRAKMRKILKAIGRPKGRVSEEGIARIGRRVGFQNDIDAEKLTPEEMERKAGNRQISTAGNLIVIEFDLKDNTPQRVNVVLPQELKAQEDPIARVLFEGLGDPTAITLEAKLDRFGVDLEALALIDRLSARGADCFAALAGIYASLRRLYDQEVEHVRLLRTNNDHGDAAIADAEVLRKKCGKPLLHERRRIGLELLYWTQDKEAATSDLVNSDDAFALRIGVEPSPAAIYPSLRISDLWLPDPLKLTDPDSISSIPWQEPPPTFVATNTDPTAMAIDGGQKLPDLRFVAVLDPPLVMPYQTAMNILSAVGATAPQTLTVPPQYASLLLNDSVASHEPASALPFMKTGTKGVLSQKSGAETTVLHEYTLVPAKADYGFKLERLPFSHPRQLVELLPTLRQWTAVSSLLKTVFYGTEPTAKSQSQSHSSSTSSNAMTLEDIVTSEHITVSQKTTPINISLSTLPVPTLSVMFPSRDGTQSLIIDVQILPNADILVTGHEVISVETEDVGVTEEELARALKACGDVGVWIEWIRSKANANW